MKPSFIHFTQELLCIKCKILTVVGVGCPDYNVRCRQCGGDGKRVKIKSQLELFT